jgi:hypothetical protein
VIIYGILFLVSFHSKQFSNYKTVLVPQDLSTQPEFVRYNESLLYILTPDLPILAQAVHILIGNLEYSVLKMCIHFRSE